ncbi:MAG: ribosomal-processing cysteine protease Prp [Treponema sp.]|nr:ribosomal-processing cysteine protease Prp [Treponema sp.]
MVKIEAALDGDGVLRSCGASGHAARGQDGGSVACAAISVLMRTAARVLSGRPGIRSRCEAPEPGFLFLEADFEAEGRDFLFAAGVFLLEGLASVAEDYPEHCSLSIRRI